MSKITLINDDCLVAMKTIPDKSVDSIVTDPPYELGFMGKSWDNTGIANNAKMWKECLRVLKPGGHLLSFSGTRTYHRMACAIEAAGFEVRDMIEWVYGSGFPKSLNIGKAVARLEGVNIPKTKGFNVAGQGIGLNPNKELRGDHPNYVKPTFDNEYEGWGTALKPAHEPICMARKPLSEKTVAENVLKYGTGGINIDESRVGTEDNLNGGAYSGGERSDGDWKDNSGFKNDKLEVFEQPTGRFPANLIHDNSEEVRECFPETKTGKAIGGENTKPKMQDLGYDDNGGNASRFFKSILYYPKVSKSERNKGCEDLPDKQWAASNQAKAEMARGNEFDGHKQGDWNKVGVSKNNHPTVKPIALMEYLIKMVTPKRGIVLDPFMGSGSTGISAKKLGFSFIGIENDPTYFKIAEQRINNTTESMF